MNKKLFLILQIVLVLITFAGSVYVAVTPANSLLNWYNVDDAFFYYKVAQNVLTGHGFTFDQINFSNGFHPLWMGVCLGVFWLSKINLVLPLRVLVLVSGLFNAATALVLFRFLKRHIHPYAALAGALFWGLYPPIYDVIIAHGMESAVSAFFVVLLLSTASKYLDTLAEKQVSYKGLFWLGLVGALTILARLDNLFVVAMIGIFALLKIKKFPANTAFDILATIVAVFTAWTFRLGADGVIQNIYSVFPMLVVSVLVVPVVLYFGGAYSSTKPQNRWNVIVRTTLAFAAGFVIEYAVLFILSKTGLLPLFSNSILVLWAAINLILVLAVHTFSVKSVQLTVQNPFGTVINWIKAQWKPTLLGGLTFGSPIAALVGAYMIVNKIFFGTFSPVSGQIKHWWSTMINTVYGRPTNLLAVLGLSNNGSNGPWSLVMSKIYTAAEASSKLVKGLNADLVFGVMLAVVFILFMLLLRAEQGRLAGKFFRMMIPAILVGCLIHITYYKITGYTHTRGWYWVSELITLTITGSLVLDAICSLVDKAKIKFSLFLVILIAGVLIFQHQDYLTGLAPYQVAKESQEAYLSETRQVEFYTEPGSKIGMTGGGLVGYFIQNRTVVNLDGLINSNDYFEAMKSGTATRFLDEIPLSYVFGKPYMLLESDPYDEILKNRLVEIGAIHGYEDFTLYKYVIKK